METTSVDKAVADLQAAKTQWARLGIAEKIGLLEEVIARTDELASDWVDAAVKAKRIPVDSPLVGEEWVSGPWALIAGASTTAETLQAIAAGDDPLASVSKRVRDNGQLVLDVFPANVFDRVLLSGYSAEVWMQPGVTTDNLVDHVATFYRQTDPEGRVELVLGAGNISSIAPLDTLDKLYAEGSVVVLKMNPVNEYMGDYLERILGSYVADGYLRFVYGGADVGAHLCAHDGIDAIHITGSARTFDTIVFGSGANGAKRKAARDPKLDKPITGELGGVGATIIVPGPWSDADLTYQAANLATMKLHNAGCNCTAMQVMVLPESWDSSDRLVQAVVEAIRSVEPRVPYYPGAAERRDALVAARPEAEDLDDGEVPRTLIRNVDPREAEDVCFTTEAFGTTLVTTRLPGDGPAEFLEAAVRFCNETLDGTLGVQLLAHPHTMKELANPLDTAVADLRYGTVGVNVWSALGYLIMRTPWGASPGHTLEDVGSGIGVVHNSYLLENTEKSVVSGPWRTFPRSVAHLDMHLATKPPWVVTNKQGAVLGEKLTHFAAKPKWRSLMGLFPPALRG